MSFKVILPGGDIRRVAGNPATLKEMVTLIRDSVKDILGTAVFGMCYIDEDGDYITVDSEQDFHAMVDHMTKEKLKVHLLPTQLPNAIAHNFEEIDASHIVEKEDQVSRSLSRIEEESKSAASSECHETQVIVNSLGGHDVSIVPPDVNALGREVVDFLAMAQARLVTEKALFLGYDTRLVEIAEALLPFKRLGPLDALPAEKEAQRTMLKEEKARLKSVRASSKARITALKHEIKEIEKDMHNLQTEVRELGPHRGKERPTRAKLIEQIHELFPNVSTQIIAEVIKTNEELSDEELIQVFVSLSTLGIDPKTL